MGGDVCFSPSLHMLCMYFSTFEKHLTNLGCTKNVCQVKNRYRLTCFVAVKIFNVSKMRDTCIRNREKKARVFLIQTVF